MAAQAKDGVSSKHSEYFQDKATATRSSSNADIDIETESAIQASNTNTNTVDLEQEYQVSRRTYIVLLIMGLTWGTCTLANVGPSTTYSYAVAQLGGKSIGSWVPNAALFPLIGLQPLWVSEPCNDLCTCFFCLLSTCQSTHG